MENHLQRAGLALIASAIGCVVISILIFLFYGGFGGLAGYDDPLIKSRSIASIPPERIYWIIFIIMSFLMAAPMFIVGRAIMQMQEWTRTVGVFLCAFSTLLFPVGTVSGLYAIWVLLQEETDFLFRYKNARR